MEGELSQLFPILYYTTLYSIFLLSSLYLLFKIFISFFYDIIYL